MCVCPRPQSHSTVSPWGLTLGIFYSLLKQLRRVSYFTSASPFTAILYWSARTTHRMSAPRMAVKSNWPHWKVDKWQRLVVEGFLPSSSAPGLMTEPVRLEGFPVCPDHQPLQPSTPSTAGWASAAYRDWAKWWEMVQVCVLSPHVTGILNKL